MRYDGFQIFYEAEIGIYIDDDDDDLRHWREKYYDASGRLAENDYVAG
jgi:hypothetical protein